MALPAGAAIKEKALQLRAAASTSIPKGRDRKHTVFLFKLVVEEITRLRQKNPATGFLGSQIRRSRLRAGLNLENCFAQLLAKQQWRRDTIFAPPSIDFLNLLLRFFGEP